MTAIADADGVFENAETRAGVEPGDFLLAKRDALAEELAPLWGEFGAGSNAEQALSAERSRLAALIRAMAAGEGKKMTEAAIEEASRCHKEYLDAMARQTSKRAEMFKMQERLRTIDFRLNRDQALLRAYASEVRT